MGREMDGSRKEQISEIVKLSRKISKSGGASPAKAGKDLLLERKDEFREFFNKMPDAVIILDRKGMLLEASEMAERMSGYGRSELLGKNVITGLGILDAKTRILVIKKMALCFSGKETPPFEIEIHTKDRRAVPIEINPQVIDYRGKKVELAVLRDVTERRKAEEEYKTIIRTSIDGFWITDMEGHFLDVNDAYCRLIGCSREELLKMKISDVEVKEKPEETAQRIRKIMKAGGDRFETQHRCKDGRIVDIEISVNFIGEAGGRLFVFIRDITERRKAEERLGESEENYRFLVGNIEEIVLIISKSGKIVFANNKAMKIFGYPEEEMVGKSIASFLTKGSMAKATYALAQEFLGKPQPEMEVEARAKSGETHILRVAPSSIPVYERGKMTGIQVNCTDVTEQRKVEDELRKRNEELEKLNKLSVGRELRMIELKKRIEELERKADGTGGRQAHSKNMVKQSAV